jgi:hypothetical protein
MEIVGPFGGTTLRFAVDGVTYPEAARDFAADLDGDGGSEDEFRGFLNSLVQVGWFHRTVVPLQIASGALAATVEITSDDEKLLSDPAVGVRWLDAVSPPGDQLGGELRNGSIATNRAVVWGHPASVPVRLPLLDEADAVEAVLVGADMKLLPDGNGGFNGELHGAIRIAGDTRFRQASHRAFLQMIASEPQQYQTPTRFVDLNRDWSIPFEEFDANSIVRALFETDVQLFDSQGNWQPKAKNAMRDSISFAIGFHLARCPSGSCVKAGPPSCADRARNGDETDIDCGGSTCHECAGGAACATAADCQTGACTNGKCADARCDDGVQDGYESDVDCGGPCAKCQLGQRCFAGDCEMGTGCSGVNGGPGKCN